MMIPKHKERPRRLDDKTHHPLRLIAIPGRFVHPRLLELPLNTSLFSPSYQDYIAVKEKYAKYLPHSSGRYAAKRFRKAQCPIVERLVNSLMMHGRNNGKKLMTVRIVKHSFEIIHLLTGEVREKLSGRLLLKLIRMRFNHQDL